MKGRAGDLCSLTLDSGWVMEGEAGHRLRFVAAHSSHEAAMNGHRFTIPEGQMGGKSGHRHSGLKGSGD
jgi:hypothetical protein